MRETNVDDEARSRHMDIFTKFNRKNIQDRQIDTLIGLPTTKGLDKLKSGVVHDKDGTPTFFTLSYSKRNKNSPSILLDIFEITLDQYLNDINLNIHIK